MTDHASQDLWDLVHKVAMDTGPAVGYMGLSHAGMRGRPVTIFVVPTGEMSEAVKDMFDEEFPEAGEAELDVERN
jgi:hypothetical protein